MKRKWTCTAPGCDRPVPYTDWLLCEQCFRDGLNTRESVTARPSTPTPQDPARGVAPTPTHPDASGERGGGSLSPAPFNRLSAIKASINKRFRKRRGHCTACGEAVTPPRFSWCSQACVDLYLDLTDTSRARRILWAKDPHCAICRHGVWVEYREGDFGYVEIPESERGAAMAIARRPVGFRLIRDHGWRWVKERRRTTERLCELDHTVPLVEGGEHEWSNLRLLCCDCHRAETAALAARLASRRRVVRWQENARALNCRPKSPGKLAAVLKAIAEGRMPS